MKYLYSLLLLLLGNTANSQTSFLPQASQNPAWYVYGFELTVCLGAGPEFDCYHTRSVSKYTIEHQAGGGPDSVYVLKEELISSNRTIYSNNETTVGTFTVKPSGLVYYVPNEPPSNSLLMYDPNLAVNDTFNPGWFIHVDGSNIADSVVLVDTINVAGADRKHWVFTEPYYESMDWIVTEASEGGLIPIDSTLQWIEGMGSNQGPFYDQTEPDPVRQLVCYEELGDTIFKLIPGSPCDLAITDISSVGDLTLNETIGIYPNPVNNQLSITIAQGDWQYTIMNTLGERLLDGNLASTDTQIKFDLANGTYLIELIEAKGNGRIIERFVVQN